MNRTVDLIIRDKSDNIALMVEVKCKLGVTTKWATEWFEYFSVIRSKSEFFLMVFPDQIFLWKTEGTRNDSSEPDYSVDAEKIFESYFHRIGSSPERISGHGFELMVASWLIQVMYSDVEDLSKEESWLVKSGLFDAICDGKLEHDVEVFV